MGTITTIILVVVVALVIIGLGPKMFWVGITTGYDKAVKMGGPILENLTSEAEQFISEESVDTVKSVISN